MVCMVRGVCFRDGTLAHRVTHLVGVSLRTRVHVGTCTSEACATHPEFIWLGARVSPSVVHVGTVGTKMDK